MLAFVPSAIYFVMAPLSVSLALWLAFAAVFAIGLRFFGTTRRIRLLDGVSLVAFGLLALYEGFVRPGSSPAEISFAFTCTSLAAALWSLAANQPFTLQYRWLKGVHEPALLIRAHLLLTSLWASVFAGLAGINSLTVVLHVVAPGWASVLSLALFGAALTFTWQFGLYIDAGRGPIPFLRRR